MDAKSRGPSGLEALFRYVILCANAWVPVSSATVVLSLPSSHPLNVQRFGTLARFLGQTAPGAESLTSIHFAPEGRDTPRDKLVDGDIHIGYARAGQEVDIGVAFISRAPPWPHPACLLAQRHCDSSCVERWLKHVLGCDTTTSSQPRDEAGLVAKSVLSPGHQHQQRRSGRVCMAWR